MDVSWLASEEGQASVAALIGVDPLKARSLLSGVPPDRVSDALTQAQHRPPDFPLTVVTIDGVQQASPVPVAQRRAQRVAESGCATVIDAGCGIGLDSWAFARAGLQVLAYEVDPTTAEVARANLAGLDVAVRTADVTEADLPPDTALFVDPARRHAHRDVLGRPVRIHDPERWRPAWSWVLDQATRRTVIARIRPGHRDLPSGAEWHCSSMSRRLVDATLWFQPLAEHPRRASVYDGSTWHELHGPGAAVHVGNVGKFIIDPDPAIVRSGLVADAALVAGGHLIDEHLAFISTDIEPPAWLGRSMAVLEQAPVKRAAAACRRHGLRSATVWARGFDRVPQLGLPQGREAIVVAARLGPERRAVTWIGVPVR